MPLFRERLEDGELVQIKDEDIQAATIMAHRMDLVLQERDYVQIVLALGILCENVIRDIAGPEWAKAVKKVIDGVPI